MEFTATASRRLILATAIAGLFGTLATPALADMETLLDKLHEKGVLSDDDYQQMRTEARANRRAEALKDASEAEKAAKKSESAATEMTGRFKDGVSWESGDKSTAISVNGRLQADYRQFQDNTAANTFDVRRAYLGVKGRFYNDITFNLTGDFAQSSGNTGAGGGATQLDEGYINFGWIKWAQLRVGQFQMPFSLDKITSDLYSNFQERNIGDTMSPDKLRGLMITGSPTTGLYYGLAVANGTGAKNTNDTNTLTDGKEGIGRVALNFAEMFGQKQAVYHVGGSYAETTLVPGAAFAGRTEARGITFFTPTAFTGSKVDRTQTGLETALAYGPVKLQAETIASNYTGNSATGGVGYDKDIKTHYVSLNWMITGEAYADSYTNSVFGRMRPNANFTGRGDGWGAWELGVRFSKWDATDFRTGGAGTGLVAAGSTAEADAMTVGLKWIVNPNTRFYLNYVHTKFDTPVAVNGTTVDAEKAGTLRAQFDF